MEVVLIVGESARFLLDFLSVIVEVEVDKLDGFQLLVVFCSDAVYPLFNRM